PPPPPPPMAHLVVEDTERDMRLAQSAALVLRHGATRSQWAWAARTLHEHPGAFACATVDAGGAVVTMRDERTFAAAPLDDRPLPFDSAILASAIYTCAICRDAGADLPRRLDVRAGAATASIRLQRESIDR
ncbi:MAG TPA: hypothetical protein VJT75_10830, partial [Thermoleophilaceae bacterium]|nr:hypothetical protein [Thermoleophilaceae bacterium]